MKWLARILLALLLVAGLAVGYAMATALDSARPVGFRVVDVRAQGAVFPVGLWYPTTGRPRPTTLLGTVVMDVAPEAPLAGRHLPLVLLSHGNGGGIGSHADLAMALADAGFVVAAPMHPGDNFRDPSAVGRARFFSDRGAQMRATLDHLLTRWDGAARIDARRIGAYGFSAGGFTVLSLAGARPDFRRVAAHCARQPEFACEVLRAAGSPLTSATVADAGGAFAIDARLRAIAVAAPGLGFAFDPASLRSLRVPVQLWSGTHDTHVPYASNARPVREALGARVEFHEVAGAGHLSFLAPCGLLRPPGLCDERDGFDRRRFHDDMNARVATFFRTALPPG